MAMSVMSNCCAQQDPLRVLYKKDPRLFVKDKLVDIVREQTKSKRKASASSAFVVPAVAVGMIALISYGLEYHPYREPSIRDDLKKVALGLGISLSVGAFCWLMYRLALATMNQDCAALPLTSILNYYYPSDSEIIIVNNQRYYNFRSYIPTDLIPVFDALYEQYHKQGSDYVHQHAAEIIRGLKNWLELHKNDVAVGE